MAKKSFRNYVDLIFSSFSNQNVKNGFAFVLQFFSLISDCLGGVQRVQSVISHNLTVQSVTLIVTRQGTIDQAIVT